ncbi:MAG: RNA methyltransferase [Clostridiales bacterium]|nr:RNA methyltransferase [Clostridiales bacterium]
MVIESTRNESVKRARSLSTKKGRLETGLHFIEGDKLVREAVISGAEFADAFIEEGHDLMQAILEGAGANVKVVSRNVMKALANTNEPQYVSATIKTPVYDLPLFYEDGLIVVLDEVQDPGNLGTIIRTADAFGVKGVLISENSADPFAPKPLRASMGSIYHMPIWQGNLEVECKKLSEQGFTLVCGHLNGCEETPTLSSKTALIIGNEGRGVSDELAELSYKYRLPIYGFAESLNASVAAGILIYKFASSMREAQ